MNDLKNSLILVGIGFAIIFLLNTIACVFVRDNNFNIFEKIFVYDAYWYESIAENGYMKYSLGDPNNTVEVTGGMGGMANWAFFPLLPYIIKLLKIATFSLVSVEILSFIFSTICYTLFIYNTIRYLKEKNIQFNVNLFFLIFIFNTIIMFFYTLYTESLTMLLIILLIRVCEKKKFLIGGFLCALLTGLKVQGCFWCIYLFVKIYQEMYKKGTSIISSFFKTILEIIKNPIYLLSLAISPMGLFIFMAILEKSHLSPLAFMDIQSGWGKESHFFLYTIAKETFFQFKPSGLFAIFFICFTIYLLKKRKFLSGSILSMYIISACSSSVKSITRYIFGTVLFPLELYYILINDINNIKTCENKTKEKGALIRLKLFYAFKICVVIPCILFFIFTDIVPLH